jgi:nitrate reductase gamma subunit
MAGARRHVILVACAIGLVAIGFGAAIASKVTGVSPSRINLAALILGFIAVSISLPLIGVPILLIGRRKFREAWSKGDPTDRQALVMHLATRIVGAVVVWILFIVAVMHH